MCIRNKDFLNACSDSVDLGKAEISNKLPDDADSAGSQTTLWLTRGQSTC